MLEAEDRDAASYVLARGMRDNPLHVAAIGDDPERRVSVMRPIFAGLLALPGRVTLGAWDRDRLVGVADSAQPGRCQQTSEDRSQLEPAMAASGSAGGAIELWLYRWGAHDPELPHSHFGPIAVDLDIQGEGAGSLLLSAYCERLDRAHLAGYLETDKEVNAVLYERFGFIVVAEDNVLGVKNWFMLRDWR